jgi:hypothetical protein
LSLGPPDAPAVPFNVAQACGKGSAMTYKPDDEMVLKAAVPEGHDPPVDRDAFARSLGELRPGLPDPGDVFATLQRVIDATLAVFQVDGASLALVLQP